MLCAPRRAPRPPDTSRETASQRRGVDPTEFGARRRGAKTDTCRAEDRQRGRLRQAVFQELGQLRADVSVSRNDALRAVRSRP